MLDEAFGLDESYAEFSGIDFSRSFPWMAEEDVSAKRLFHATKTPLSYGYILPDGTLLDFSRPPKDGSGSAGDHSQILRAFSEKRVNELRARFEKANGPSNGTDDMYEEIKYEACGAGLVRLYRSGDTYMIHIVQKPTEAQLDALYDIRDAAEDSKYRRFELFVPDRGLIQYESPEDFGRRFMNDVRNSF